MRSLLYAAAIVAVLPFASPQDEEECEECQSFAIDFQDQGSYFQNSESTEPFTALQEFEGCTNDTTHNVFVDPNGDQYECSMSDMQPDDTPQLITWYASGVCRRCETEV